MCPDFRVYRFRENKRLFLNYGASQVFCLLTLGFSLALRVADQKAARECGF
jgi:hypothetical protein